MKWIGIAIASLFIASPVFACGVHGTNAGNDINSWLADNANGAASSGNIGGGNTDGDFNSGNSTWADGGQSSHDDNGNVIAFSWEGGDDGDVEIGEDFAGEGSNEGTGMANENYWVNITLPNGNVVTINTTPSSEDHGGGGAEIEAWLRDQGIAVIRDWFENYEPLDDEDSTYTG